MQWLVGTWQDPVQPIGIVAAGINPDRRPLPLLAQRRSNAAPGALRFLDKPMTRLGGIMITMRKMARNLVVSSILTWIRIGYEPVALSARIHLQA